MASFTRRGFVASIGAAASVAGLGVRSAGAQASYPNRPITVICPWGAGGGTDATARIVASLLEKELGQPVNVINRTGGSGVVGHQAIASAQPDGYTLGIITVEIAMMHWQGLTELTPKSYAPVALMNEDPPGIQVNAAAPYKNVKDLADAIKAAPRRQAEGVGHRPGRHLAPGPDRMAAGDGLEARSRGLGAVERRCARHAGPRGRRHRPRPVLGSGSAGDDRGRQGAKPRHHGARAQPDLSEHSDAQGGDGHRLLDRRLARLRRPRNLPADVQAKLVAAHKKVYDSKEYKTSWPTAASA